MDKKTAQKMIAAAKKAFPLKGVPKMKAWKFHFDFCSELIRLEGRGRWNKKSFAAVLKKFEKKALLLKQKVLKKN